MNLDSVREFKFPGDHTARVTPVPIPNTEVKPRRADDTARVTVWERRSSPGLKSKGRLEQSRRPFCFCDIPFAGPLCKARRRDGSAKDFVRYILFKLLLYFFFNRLHLWHGVGNHIVNSREVAGSIGYNASHVFSAGKI